MALKSLTVSRESGKDNRRLLGCFRKAKDGIERAGGCIHYGLVIAILATGMMVGLILEDTGFFNEMARIRETNEKTRIMARIRETPITDTAEYKMLIGKFDHANENMIKLFETITDSDFRIDSAKHGANEDMIKLLEATDACGRTMLMKAAEEGLTGFCEFIIDRYKKAAMCDSTGRYIAREDADGRNAITIAAEKGFIGTCELLIREYLNCYLDTVELKAIKAADGIGRLINIKDTLRINAALALRTHLFRYGTKTIEEDFRFVKRIEQEELNHDFVQDIKCLECYYEYYPMSAWPAPSLTMAELKARINGHLKGGASIMARNEDGCTALMFAAQRADKEICRFLIAKCAEAGGDVKKLIEATNKHGLTALMYGAYGRDWKAQTCAFLIEKYAEAGGDVKKLIEAKTTSGYTALIYFAIRNNSDGCKLLVTKYAEAGGDVKKLIKARGEGMTALTHAEVSCGKDSEAAAYLKSFGAKE